MDAKYLSLHDIYKSIEDALKRLKDQLKEVQSVSGDATTVEGFVNNVLRPLSDGAKQTPLETLESLRALCTTPTTTFRTESPVHSVKQCEDKKETISDKLAYLHLPPVPPRQPAPQPPKFRPFAPSNIRYPAISPSLTQSPSSKHGARPSRPYRRITPQFLSADRDESLSAVDHSLLAEELTSYVDNLETSICGLQAMFAVFTQRVLVPLQTFCKHTDSSRKLSKAKQEQSAFERINSGTNARDLHQCEFLIVQTMNSLKHLLWAPSKSSSECNYPLGGVLQELTELVDCSRFPVVRILPEALVRFNLVINNALSWLNRDRDCTENARCGLQRAHRRYVKTERMWKEIDQRTQAIKVILKTCNLVQKLNPVSLTGRYEISLLDFQARHTHRQLSNEFDHTCREIETNIIRMETLQSDAELLQEDLEKCEDQQRTAEAKFLDTNGASERFRIQHKVLLKRISFLKKKIEAKERNSSFMKTRIRSLKADQDAIGQKILISKEFTESLQESLIKLFHYREAWRKSCMCRYLEKTDPKVLKKKMGAVGLRIPSPTVREKTFVLKTRMENLKQAIEIASDRLTSQGVHWSVLCHQLTWPNRYTATLNVIDRKTHRSDASDDDAQSSTSSEKVRCPLPAAETDAESCAAEQIVDHVQAKCRDSDKEQCLFMLRLWLRVSGRHANLEQLVKALCSARVKEVAARLKDLNGC